MDILDEKKAIYEQMRLLIEERREITKIYYDLKVKLDSLEEGEKNVERRIVSKTTNNSLARDIENQKYMIQKKNGNTFTNSYQDVALKIASYLKEIGMPIATKELYEVLRDKCLLTISYNNLVNNILPKIQNDPAINVERAWKGFWQYRLK